MTWLGWSVLFAAVPLFGLAAAVGAIVAMVVGFARGES